MRLQHSKVDLHVKDKPLPFFRVLSGSKLSENYLSRVFQACFTQSPSFANSVLSLLWKTCRLERNVPDATTWVCDYQPATPNGGNIRPDLCLRPSAPTVDRAYKPIFVESKVDAVLGEEQLKRYVQSGTKILVAVTKNWPEVSKERLSNLGINHLRWQDFARALSTAPSDNAKDRFFCDAFLEFLEYSGMTYREDISLKDLEGVRTLLTRIGTPAYLAFVPGPGFDLADSCLALLRETRRIAQETMPKLTGCANWGPGYCHYKQNNNDSPTIDWHSFGFEMFRKGHYSKSSLWCALCFSAHKRNAIHWLVAHYGSKASDGREIMIPISQFTVRKKLDANLLAESVVRAVTHWKPF